MNASEDCSRISPISVILPTFNGESFILEALDSIRAQKHLPMEVIVVDDCSKDQTIERVKEAAASFPVPLHLICLKKNSGGPSFPINTGIRAAKGELIAVLDQDDLWLPDHLLILGKLLTENPDCTISCGLSSILGTDIPWIDDPVAEALFGNTWKTAPGSSRASIVPSHQIHGLFLKYVNFIHGYPGFVFRRKDWAEKKGINESLKIAGDFDLLCWLSRKGNAAVFPGIVYRRRIHGNNVTENNWLRCDMEATSIIAGYLRDFPLLTMEDRKLFEETRDKIYWLAKCARNAGFLKISLQYYLFYQKLMGWNWGTIKNILMIIPGRMYERLSFYCPFIPRPKHYDPEINVFRDGHYKETRRKETRR